jgi:hypothetical protein
MYFHSPAAKGSIQNMGTRTLSIEERVALYTAIPGEANTSMIRALFFLTALQIQTSSQNGL